jgi:hypothetical protein
MVAPEKGIAEVPGVRLIGSEVLCERPRCVRVEFTIEREGSEENQTAIFLSLPVADGYSLVPVTARDVTSNSAARLTDIVEGWKRLNSKNETAGELIGALNGGFFIFIERLWCRASRFYPEHTRVGDAIGWLMTDGNIRFPPLYGRTAFVTASNGRSSIARADMTHVNVELRDSRQVRIARAAELINTPDPERVVCYTPVWPEKATPRRRGTIEVSLIGHSVAAADRNGGIHVPVNGCVISAPEASWGGLDERDLRFIESVTYSLNEKGRAEFGDVLQAVEAGPALVSKGVAHEIDTAFLYGQGFTPGAPPFPAYNSVLTHHRILAPRVCIGISGGTHITAALFEGRRPGESEGLTLSEAARFMAAAGCDEAVNLDGGASAEIILNSEALNVPQLGAEKKWLDRGLDFLNKYMRSGTLPRAEELGSSDERTIGTALMIVCRD